MAVTEDTEFSSDIVENAMNVNTIAYEFYVHYAIHVSMSWLNTHVQHVDKRGFALMGDWESDVTNVHLFKSNFMPGNRRTSRWIAFLNLIQDTY